MLPAASVIKKIKSPGQDTVINTKTSITCSNVPEGLFDETTAKKHFSRFGRVQKIRLFPKRLMCIVEYHQPSSAESAVLNAGAFDGFMFDVTRTKARTRRRSKKDDDPDWVPDSDVEEELSAMRGAPSYKITRQSKDIHPEVSKQITPIRVAKQTPIRKKIPVREIIEQSAMSHPAMGVENSVMVTMTQTSLSINEAATELHQLRSKISLTPDEQWRTLDARDRILRSWGGAGSRVKVGGATIGTCPDMCPEKELLHRQAEHQVMTLETVPDTDGQLEPVRAVKQYSRSSADQEIPMCYELRPASVLMRTCAYLLHEIADTTRQVSLADWFHFMWDRFRGIRKDITQQALCCAESICLVEMCARFHAHCAARLADLEHTQFDQKLNTDNLTKCLQTLKHMYADVSPEQKPREAEFRGYVALLNLGDANFWWEIKQLPQEVQKSEPIIFSIQVFNAIDNNNYVRFFRLIKKKATYLQACILLRYFNDVRARGLARVVKAYAPRGGSRFPAEDLINALAFESVDNMKAFINHYGLRFAKTEDCELTIILDRNQFIEDSDPYPMARAINLIESKRQCTVGEVIAGGKLPVAEFNNHTLYTSFNKDGKLKDAALIAEDQGYNTVNDSNKDVQTLKVEIQRLSQGAKTHTYLEKLSESKGNHFAKTESKTSSPTSAHIFAAPINVASGSKLFSFKPAIPVAPTEIIKNSPEKMFRADVKNTFSFSKPQNSLGSFADKDSANTFMPTITKNVFFSKTASDIKNVFGTTSNENKEQNLFRGTKSDNLFKKAQIAESIFGQSTVETKQSNFNKNLFGNIQSKNIFSIKEETKGRGNHVTFGTKPLISDTKDDSLLSKPDSTVILEKGGNIFAKPTTVQASDDTKGPSNIFGTRGKFSHTTNIFMKPTTVGSENKLQSVFAPNGEDSSNDLSPGSLFKSACNPENGSDARSYSIFQSKNKAQSVADNILNSVNVPKSITVYEFDQVEAQRQLDIDRFNEERIKEDERRLQEKLKKEEERKQELRLQEEERRKEEARRKQELKKLEEKRKKEEERNQEELRKTIEEEKKAELKRIAEEAKKKFKQVVETESFTLVEELIDEVNIETNREALKEELKNLKNLINYASDITEEVFVDLCNEICYSEIKAEKFWTDKITRKWFYIWRKQFIRNSNRRRLLEDTPVWLTERTPLQEASYLRRRVENAALKNMNAIHRGYKFIGELRQIPSPEPYNIMEIIKSPLLKRMKQINYPYDKCFFWKVTLVSPGADKWLCRKINIEKWVLDVFSDKKKHEESDSLINVRKQSWNHLIDFAISVSLTNKQHNMCHSVEAIDGTNGILFYDTENPYNLIETIEEILKHKYPYQVIPVAVIIPKIEDISIHNNIHTLLTSNVKNNLISAFKIFVLDHHNISDSLNMSTKSALKWMAKMFPQNPLLEIDFLKSICQRYLGNDIWCRFKYERDGRMNAVLKDLHKLIKCYNTVVDKLTDVITNEDLFHYSSFPLEFKIYLDNASPFPKPYEFIPSNVKNTENISAIKDIMKQLKLPNPSSTFNPLSEVNMQQQIRAYCHQINWFEDPEEVVCKVVAVLPNELSDSIMNCKNFTKSFAQYDLIDLLNIIVYEKINGLKNFNNRFAMYERSILEEYRNGHWLYEVNVISEMKHRAFEYEDDLDYFIEAKRRKIAIDSVEYLMIEDKDCTLIEENIKETDKNISEYSNCTKAVHQLEREIEEEKKKSIEFEKFLKAALSDV